LGATKSETVFKAVMPAALPSVFSGLILATARAAGEVSPLLLVGAVKFSPSLPLSSRAPFIEFEQKFMHLGFQLFDAVLFARLPPGRPWLGGMHRIDPRTVNRCFKLNRGQLKNSHS